MSLEKPRRKYDDAFKREAVRLMTEEKMKPSHVERDLGITNGLVRKWKRVLDEDNKHAFPGSGYQRPEQAEITQLRKENERLRRERDILKKATAFFAKNQ